MKLNLYTIGKRIEALGRAIADIAPALERKPEPEPAKPAPKPKADLPFKVDDVVQFNRDCFFGKIEAADTTLPQSDVIGWLYDNEDTGREYAVDHPVKSGEVPDATNIVPATAENLLVEMKSAWKAWSEDRIAISQMSDENYRLRKSLEKISSPTQTEGLLWWQVEARAALSETNAPATHVGGLP